jgi:hypothetical protein
MSNTEDIISYEKTFEEEIYDIMEKFISSNKLSISDIKACREICTQYENRILALDLTEKLKFYCKIDDYDINFNNEDEKITVLSFESIGGANRDDKNLNKKDHIVTMTINFSNHLSTLIYEIVEEYSDNGKQKYTVHKFTIDGNVILKKENQSMKEPFINLSYLKDLIENNKIKLSIIQFLRLFTKLFGVLNIFEKNICEIENEPQKYYKDKSWESDSDISMSDDDKMYNEHLE